MKTQSQSKNDRCLKSSYWCWSSPCSACSLISAVLLPGGPAYIAPSCSTRQTHHRDATPANT